MPHILPNPTDPLTTHDFKPGFTFEFEIEPEKWESVTIHQNCAEELLAYLMRCFKRSPESFRRPLMWVNGVSV
jgi:hypothetical protein